MDWMEGWNEEGDVGGGGETTRARRSGEEGKGNQQFTTARGRRSWGEECETHGMQLAQKVKQLLASEESGEGDGA